MAQLFFLKPNGASLFPRSSRTGLFIDQDKLSSLLIIDVASGKQS